MTEDALAAQFEELRPDLRSVAYRLLGSLSDADDAVQETWLRLDRAETSEIDNLGAWLTTVVARISLNMLRSRGTRREQSLDAGVPEPLISPAEGMDPEQEALLADSVGLAMLVVLESLSPAERVAFVLHDLFAIPFGEIAAMIERSPEAARQLASRARRRVRGAAPSPDGELTAQREVVDAFFAAGRDGDFERLVSLLHPDVTLRADFGVARRDTVIGAEDVAGRAKMFADPIREVRAATVNGAAGAVIYIDSAPVTVMGFTVVAGEVVAIDALGDPERVAALDFSALEPRPPSRR